MELKGKRVLVFGAARSGIGAAHLLHLVGAFPVIYDGNLKLSEEQVRSHLPEEAANIPVVIGELTDQLIMESDLCVISPGVPTDIEPVRRIRAAGVEIWGEVELACHCSRGQVLAITGTNGKTTSVTLLGELMKKMYGEDVFVVGNIGFPYTEAALQTDDQSVCVAEVSSFQLETIKSFHPHVAAITNITPDHLNRHHTMEEYIRVKEQIILNQTKQDVVVLNYEDEILRSFGERIEQEQDAPSVFWFSSLRKLKKGMYADGNVLKYADGTGIIDIIRTDELHILGRHNYENVCTAVLCALAVSMPVEQIREVLRSFKGVEHRIEFAGEVNGVRYYNDSKGTNPDAAIKAVEAMTRPTVLIGGGYDKDSDYSSWVERFPGRVKALVLIGATKEKIAACAAEHGFQEVYLCNTFEECFRKCVSLAESGDAILLSPACASWGMFEDYEQRGRVFKELVRSLDEAAEERSGDRA